MRVGLLLTGLLLASSANAGMNNAVQAALYGPNIKKEKVYGHHFNIKKAEISQEDGKTIITGQISHHLRFRHDDQVYYEIVKRGNSIEEIERRINRGGLAPLAAPVISTIGRFLTGESIPEEEVEKIGRAIGSAVDGRWTTACDAIIANIALRAK